MVQLPIIHHYFSEFPELATGYRRLSFLHAACALAQLSSKPVYSLWVMPPLRTSALFCGGGALWCRTLGEHTWRPSCVLVSNTSVATFQTLKMPIVRFPWRVFCWGYSFGWWYLWLCFKMNLYVGSRQGKALSWPLRSSAPSIRWRWSSSMHVAGGGSRPVIPYELRHEHPAIPLSSGYFGVALSVESWSPRCALGWC